MPLEAKPLFRPDVLRGHHSGFALPAHVESLRPKLVNWAELIGSNRIDALNEQQILPDFLTDFFLGLLAATVNSATGAGRVAARPVHQYLCGGAWWIGATSGRTYATAWRIRPESC